MLEKYVDGEGEDLEYQIETPDDENPFSEDEYEDLEASFQLKRPKGLGYDDTSIKGVGKKKANKQDAKKRQQRKHRDDFEW